MSLNQDPPVSTPSSLRLTCLVDNTVYLPSLRAEHGLSILAEADSVKVLLDAGQTAQIIQNARMLGVELSSVSHVAVSHGHYDHTGGLESVLGKARSATVHAHTAAFVRKYGRREDGTYRHIGCPLRLEDLQSRCAEMLLDHQPQELPSGFGLTGEVPHTHNWEKAEGAYFIDSHGAKLRDPLLDDQSLFWDGPDGLVVVAGCAHAGVVNTIERACELTGKHRVAGVVGGLHLVSASDDRIERTIDAFRRFGVERIGLGHCTGFQAIRRFFDVLGDRCFLCPVGTRVGFGA